MVAAALCCGLLTACGIAPRHPVLPYPDHIRAAIDVGDTVDVVMNDGTRHRLTVSHLDDTGLADGELRVPVNQIATLSKRSWQPPRNPCDDGEPLQCSIPGAVTALSEFHDRYRGEFQPSCAQHDLCYRYGYRTYRLDRSDCDAEFLDNMKVQCGARLDLDPFARAECQLAARHLHDAVVRHGERAFQTDQSRYCEYAGPPSAVRAR